MLYYDTTLFVVVERISIVGESVVKLDLQR